MNGKHILVVDDEPDIRNLVSEILADEGYEVTVAENTAAARISRDKVQPDLVLLDIWIPGEDGISLLKDWQQSDIPPFPVIMMSGHGTVETAVEATRLGAYDFIEKPLTLAKLLLTVKRALESSQKGLVTDSVGHSARVDEPVGSSRKMEQLRDQLKRVAEHDSWVLITGEPGTGKETLGRFIHSLSERRTRPFIARSAISMFDSDAGGHVALLEEINRGCLFINEVADMSLSGQARFHNAVPGEMLPRTGRASDDATNIRVIAATSRDLQREIQAGRFREDLYYRLNVIPIQAPPLRERVEDISELLTYYVNFYSSQEDYPYRHFSISAQNRLLHHSWPGNVRELRNLVQRLLILGTGEEITVSELEAELSVRQLHDADSSDTQEWHKDIFDLPMREARETFERSYLQHQLKQAEGSVSKLAARVGMERTHLYRKLRSLGINPKETE